jgi:hypothetical protein
MVTSASEGRPTIVKNSLKLSFEAANYTLVNSNYESLEKFYYSNNQEVRYYS